MAFDEGPSDGHVMHGTGGYVHRDWDTGLMMVTEMLYLAPGMKYWLHEPHMAVRIVCAGCEVVAVLTSVRQARPVVAVQCTWGSMLNVHVERPRGLYAFHYP
ncbi:MAG: hypothetical protein NVS4B8_15170 [Herpetosiphon sp.]